jgi:hypothetical protein
LTSVQMVYPSPDYLQWWHTIGYTFYIFGLFSIDTIFFPALTHKT